MNSPLKLFGSTVFLCSFMLVNNGIADVVEGGPVDFRGLLGEDDGSVFEPLGFPGEEFDVEDKLEAIVETPGAEDA